LLVPVPTYFQIETIRRDDLYPGKICRIYKVQSSRLCDLVNDFVDENLRLVRLSRESGPQAQRSLLYNRQIDDNHFSPAGAALWAQVVGKRLTRLLDSPHAAKLKTASAMKTHVTASSGHEPPR
jgi:hypothetical protein